MHKAEQIKVDIVRDLYAAKILKLEHHIAENDDDEKVIKHAYLQIKQIQAQRKLVESYINACLFERIQGESRFRGLKKVLPQL